MRAGPILALLIALTLGGLAAYMTASWMEERASASVPREVTESGTIVVAARDLNFGTRLSAEDLVAIDWPRDRVPQGAYTSINQMLEEGTRVVLSPMSTNEPVLSSKITGAGQRASLSALIEPGMRAVTIRVDEVRGVAGFVLPGERVDIALIRQEGGDSVSEILLQNVRVLAVDQLANERTDQPTIARAVTLEVSTEQAQKIILASDIGRLSLLLRQPGAELANDVRRVTRSDLSVPEVASPVAEMPASPETEPRAPAGRTIGVVRGTVRSEYTISQD